MLRQVTPALDDDINETVHDFSVYSVLPSMLSTSESSIPLSCGIAPNSGKQVSATVSKSVVLASEFVTLNLKNLQALFFLAQIYL